MEAAADAASSLRRMMEQYQFTGTTSLGLAILLIALSFAIWPANQKSPPMLRETIPFLSNTYQYAANLDGLFSRAVQALNQKNIVGFYLGGKKTFFITGPQNIQAFFRSSPSISVQTLVLYTIKYMMGATPDDVAKFANDNSGRHPTPLPGTEDTPEHKRYWASMHNIMHKYLSQTRYATALADTYQRFFGEELDANFPLGEWTETRVIPMMKQHMCKAAIRSLQGDRIFEVAPNLLDVFWEFDKVLGTLLFGPPKWLFPGMYATAERFCAATGKYFQDATANFDWDGPDAEVDWEPVFGSRFWREFSKWMIQSEFSPRSCAGFTGVTGIVAMNANTIPVATWAIIEMTKDPSLLAALRKEVEPTYITDPATGRRTIDLQALAALPLLQSVYTEIMRMRISLNVTREVVRPLEVEGYTLAAGTLLQAPTELSHYKESVWGVEGHPATEFWAERHVKYVGGVAAFEVRGRPTDFFPYGGGIPICPGRHFAKQEIMLTIALLATKYEFEFVEWVKMDGTPSNRPPRSDPKYKGAAGVPPDVDMKVRLKRVR